MSELQQTLSSAVYDFCEQKGLIKLLEESLKIPEAERFAKLNISQDGLGLLDAVHCVYDRSRTEAFLLELDTVLSKEHIVIEAGIGTGILSFFAAQKAAQVYGFEINPEIYNLAQEIREFLIEKKLLANPPIFFLQDATKAVLPHKADVLISENLYTGMFFEKQVQIVNHLQPLLNENPILIPTRMCSYVIPVQLQEPKLAQAELLVPSVNLQPVFSALGDATKYNDLSFQNAGQRVDTTVPLQIHEHGDLNAILIYSEVIMPSGASISRNATTFLNNDIILGIKPEVSVQTGQKVSLHIKYDYGSAPETMVLGAEV